MSDEHANNEPLTRSVTTSSLEDARRQVAAQQVKMEHGDSSLELQAQLQDRCAS